MDSVHHGRQEMVAEALDTWSHGLQNKEAESKQHLLHNSSSLFASVWNSQPWNGEMISEGFSVDLLTSREFTPNNSSQTCPDVSMSIVKSFYLNARELSGETCMLTKDTVHIF